jgi:hypothetical protein
VKKKTLQRSGASRASGRGRKPRGAAPPGLDHLFDRDAADDRPEVVGLFARIVAEMPALDKLLAEADGHWGGEDAVYRFYHQSFKVYGVQGITKRIVAQLHALAPGKPLNEWFMRIVREGTGRTFRTDDNARWLEATRPQLEAFFHARYFLAMIVKYGKELKHPPQLLPNGWAAVLYLYGLR